MQNPSTPSSATPTTVSIPTPLLAARTGVSGSGLPVSGATGFASIEQQDLRSMAMQQQQLMQAAQQQHAPANTPVNSAGADNLAGVLGLYRQLINHQLAQQQQPAQPSQPSQPSHTPGATISTSQLQQQGITTLPQQFNTTLHLQQHGTSQTPTSLQRSFASIPQQPVAATSVLQTSAQHAQQQPSNNTAAAGLIAQLLTSNPALVQSLVSGNQSLATLILSTIASQQQQQQQQQLIQQLLQSNPLSAANLYVYQSLLQQQQQATSPPQQSAQLGLLTQLVAQLLGSQPATAVGGNQAVQQLLASFQQQQQQTQPAALTSPDVQQLLLRYAREQAPQMASLPPDNNHPGQLSAQSALSLLSSLGALGGNNLLAGADIMADQSMGQHSATPTAESALSSAITRIQQQQQQPTPQQITTPTLTDRSLSNAQSVEDHISRLISENEAIVEPNPVLLKRRPYHRQSTSNSINSQASQECIGGSQRGSPGGNNGGSQLKANTTRSHSLHESPLLNSLRLGGSLTSGQPIIRARNSTALVCSFCQLKFPNEAGLEAHEFRCSKKEQLTKQHSQPQLRIAGLTQAAQQSPQHQLFRQLHLQQQQQKLLAQQQLHQSNIAALVGGGMGVAPDSLLGGVEQVKSAAMTEQHQQFLQALSALTGGSSIDELNDRLMLKKQLIDAAATQSANDTDERSYKEQQNANNMLIDVVADDEPSTSGPNKVAKLDFDSDLNILQQLIFLRQQRLNNDASQAADPTDATTLAALQLAPNSANVAHPEKQEQPVSAQKAIIQKAAAEYNASAAANRQPQQVHNNDNEEVRTAKASEDSSESVSRKESAVPSKRPNEMTGMESEGMIAYTLECVATRNCGSLPYLLTLGEKLMQGLKENEGEPVCTTNPSTQQYRNRNITSDTFVCLNRPRPVKDVHKNDSAVSAYSDCWPSARAKPEEEQMILHLLNACATTPKAEMGECRYTVASGRLSRTLQTTHSTVWELQNRHGIRASIQDLLKIDVDRAAGYRLENETPSQRNKVDSHPTISNASGETLGVDHLPASAPSEGAELNHNNHQPVSSLNAPQHAKENLPQHGATNDEPAIVTASQPSDMCGTTNTTALACNNRQQTAQVERLKVVTKLPASISKAALEATMKMNVRTEEVDVYVRGRGRGRYVCDKCGIRCKKPSMLRKHMKSHTNLRPFKCITCNFSFKTKGNLTKHLLSKAHRKRMVDSYDERHLTSMGMISSSSIPKGDDDDMVDRLIVDENAGANESFELAPSTELCDAPSIVKLSMLESRFVNDEYDALEKDSGENDSEESEDELAGEFEPAPLPAYSPNLTYRRYGQELVLVERATHTPPTLWGATVPVTEMKLEWPRGERWDERSCHSAPPVALCQPVSAKGRRSKHTRRVSRSSRRSSKCAAEELATGASSGGEGGTDRQALLFSDVVGGKPGLATTSFAPEEAQQQQLISNFIPAESPYQTQTEGQLNPIAIVHPTPLIVLNRPGSVYDQAAVGPLVGHPSQAESIDLNVLKITQPELAAFIASAIIARSEAQSAQVVEAQRQPAQAQPGKLTIVHPPIQQGTSSCSTAGMEDFLTTEEYSCSMCDKQFRKESELNLHRQTHLIEHQQHVKSRIHYCTECRVNLRTKAALLKHMETFHGNAHIAEDAESAEVGAGTSLSVTAQKSGKIPHPSGVVPPSLGFRNFFCADCNLGFRSNGVLGKHLRSKNHVKTLITQGKLPSDAANLIRDNAYLLSKIDASDSTKARDSLLDLLSEVRGTSTAADSSSPQPPSLHDEGEGSQAALSLECREHLGSVSPIAPQTVNSVLTVDNSNKVALKHGGTKRKASSSNNGEDGAMEPAQRRKLATHAAPHQHLMVSPYIEVSQRATAAEQHLPPSRVFVPMMEGSVGEDDDPNENCPASPLHSLASVAVAAAAASSSSSPLCVNSIGNTQRSTLHGIMAGTHPVVNKTITISNVWIPPRLDQVAPDGEQRTATPDSVGEGGRESRDATKFSLLEASGLLDSVASNRSAEETGSELSTGRSESSTPVQRATSNNGLVGAVNGAMGASPIPAITRCQLCDVDFHTSTDLRVHFHTEHVVMRDGRDYRCPKQHCDKVYPSRETLRLHIIAHYFGATSGAAHDEESLTNSPLNPVYRGGTTSPAGITLRKKSASLLLTPTAPIPLGRAQSPGTTTSEGTTQLRSWRSSDVRRHSNRCGLVGQGLDFDSSPSTTDVLPPQGNTSSIGHSAGHLLMCCKCNTGFTTTEALQSHQSTFHSCSNS